MLSRRTFSRLAALSVALPGFVRGASAAKPVAHDATLIAIRGNLIVSAELSQIEFISEYSIVARGHSNHIKSRFDIPDWLTGDLVDFVFVRYAKGRGLLVLHDVNVEMTSETSMHLSRFSRLHAIDGAYVYRRDRPRVGDLYTLHLDQNSQFYVRKLTAGAPPQIVFSGDHWPLRFDLGRVIANHGDGCLSVSLDSHHTETV